MACMCKCNIVVKYMMISKDRLFILHSKGYFLMMQKFIALFLEKITQVLN